MSGEWLKKLQIKFIMHKGIFIIILMSALIFGLASSTRADWPENRHRFGAGIHYWASLEDIIIEEADDDGLAIMLSYQYQIIKFFTIEADLEFMGKGYAGAPKTVIAPQIYVLIGRGLYGGAGVGMSYTDGNWANSPFFALRAGVDLEIIPSIYLDLNVNYRSEEWGFSDFDENIQLKTITLGAMLRYEF